MRTSLLLSVTLALPVSAAWAGSDAGASRRAVAPRRGAAYDASKSTFAIHFEKFALEQLTETVAAASCTTFDLPAEPLRGQMPNTKESLPLTGAQFLRMYLDAVKGQGYVTEVEGNRVRVLEPRP